MRTLLRTPLVVGLASLLAALLWMLGATWIVPPLIERAYRRESVALFNGLISGQRSFGVEHYLALWDAIRWRLALGLLALALCGLALSIPAVGGSLDRRLRRLLPADAVPNADLGFSARRVRVIHATIVLILGGSLLAIVGDAEVWPFSPYGMYSETQRAHTFSVVRPLGVTSDQPSREVPLYAFRYVQPLDQQRLQRQMARLDIARDRDSLLRQALQDVLVRYNTLQRAGRHDGPPLRGVRLYRLHWQAEPSAHNVDRPERAELLFEIGAAPGS